MTTYAPERTDLIDLRVIERESVPSDPLKREVMGLLRSWERPPSWDDQRRWMPTMCGRDGHINYGPMPGDLWFRLVAVANGRWFALPLLREAERPEFIEELGAFAKQWNIRLWIWRHPGSERKPGSAAELIYPTCEIASLT